MESYKTIKTKLQWRLAEKGYDGYIPSLLALMTHIISIYMDGKFQEYEMVKCKCEYKDCKNETNSQICEYKNRIMWKCYDEHKQIFASPSELKGLQQPDELDLRIQGKKASKSDRNQMETELKKNITVEYGNSVYNKCEIIVELIALCVTREVWDLENCTCAIDCYEKMLPYLFFFNGDVCQNAVCAIIDGKIKNYALRDAVRKCFRLAFLLKKRRLKNKEWMYTYSRMDFCYNLKLALNYGYLNGKKILIERLRILEDIGCEMASEISQWKICSKLMGYEGLKLLGVRGYLQLLYFMNK